LLETATEQALADPRAATTGNTAEANKATAMATELPVAAVGADAAAATENGRAEPLVLPS
jgi:hypothetical protein